jgi:hypothetical protein
LLEITWLPDSFFICPFGQPMLRAEKNPPPIWRDAEYFSFDSETSLAH